MIENNILLEVNQLPESLKAEVLRFILFIKKEHEEKKNKESKKERLFGISKARYKLAADFDEPLEDFKDYM